MEAKLIKMMEGYIVSLTGDIDDIYAITNKELAEEHGFYYISLKNCEAIANGYDLDELAKTDADLRYNQPGEEDLWLTRVTGIEYGFNLALSILGDKKFSEEDLRIAIDRVWNWCEDDKDEDCSSMTELRNKHIQSLQQTEWDCIIEMECVMGCQNLILNGKNSVCCGDKKPKLDADGCLILNERL